MTASFTTARAHHIASALDRFYCTNVVIGLWADAVVNRLTGFALYLLNSELAEVAASARSAASHLAARIGDLDGVITADPRQLLANAVWDTEYSLPDCGDVRAVADAGRGRYAILAEAYRTFLDETRDDHVTYSIVVKLLADLESRIAEIEAALQQ